MKPAHRTVIVHDLGAVGRTVNRPLQNGPTSGGARRRSSRSHPVSGSTPCKAGVIDALAEVASDRRLVTVVRLEAHTWLPHSTCWPRHTLCQ